MADPTINDFWSQFNPVTGQPYQGYQPLDATANFSLQQDQPSASTPGQPVDSGSLIQPTNTMAPTAQAAPAQSFGNLSDPNAWMALVQNPAQLKQWLMTADPRLQQLFASNPSLADYYVQQIQKSPGANAAEQSGSANYWINKALQDPGITGQSGSASGGNLSGLGYGGDPLTTLRNTPGYQFAFGQGLDAIQRSAAAKGTLLTGGTLKALQGYGTGLADQTYQESVNNALNLSKLGLQAAS